MTANKNIIPPELRNKISPYIIGAIERRHLVIPLGYMLSVIALYGPIVGLSDHNGIRYLLGPLLFPSAGALYFTLFPFRPYLGIVYLEQRRDIDACDPVVMGLVEIYKSDAAQRFLWLTAMKISGILLVIMGLLTALVRNSLSWTWESPGLSMFLVSGWVGPLMLVAYDYIGWGLKNWATATLRHNSERT